MSNNNKTYDRKDKTAFDLFNSILNDDNQNQQTTVDNSVSDIERCYISGQPLDHSKTTLPCGHSFNYLPLIQDLIKYKKTHSSSYHSFNSFFFCPYCRKNFYETIPYRPDISKLSYNRINKPINLSYEKHTCYNTTCDKNATVPIGNNTFACYLHYKSKMPKPSKMTKSVKNIKITKSSDLSNVKQSITDNTNGCCAILKTGKRKGHQCSCKTLVENSAFCKRHYSTSQ